MRCFVEEKSLSFLKTPNFALEPADIQRFEQGTMPASRYTLQHLILSNSADQVQAKNVYDAILAFSGILPRPTTRFDAGLHVDALFQDTADTLPPAIILDYLYGVAAYEIWKYGPVHDVVERYYQDHYESTLPLPRSLPSSGHNSAEEEDDDDNPVRDPDYAPGTPQMRPHHTQKRNGLSKAMDDMNLALMLLSGTTPEKRRREWEKRMEEEELIAREESRRKVMEWQALNVGATK